MRPATLAHLSDLHFGIPAHERTAGSLVRSLLAAKVDHVVVTGDVTNRGRRDELARFHELFAPFRATGRLTVVPGNHDRLGDDVAPGLMRGARVDVVSRPGLHLVRVDSTAEHNRQFLRAHGELSREVLARVDEALDMAPAGTLCAVLLHHHVLPLPEESMFERLSATLGLPNTAELRLGSELLELVRGRCDLVLHGHRHVPTERRLDDTPLRPLALYNAGSSTTLARMRIFRHEAGRLLAAPHWLHADVEQDPLDFRTVLERPALASRVWSSVQRLGMAVF